MTHATAQCFGSPPPGALGRDQKVKYHKISITKLISKIFKPNLVCFLTNERYKNIFIPSPGSCPRGGTQGYCGDFGGGGQKPFAPKFNQIWCVSYLHESHMQRHKFLDPPLLGPWGGAKNN